MKAKLKKIADIRNGYQFRGKVEPLDLATGDGAAGPLPPGVVRVIQIKDIDDDRRLHTGDLTSVQIDADPEKYEARQGDVLFLARGHRLFATAITEPVRDAVATGYFFILRPKTDKLRPEYLAWYINQPPFQAVLRTYMKGTHQPLVSRRDIEDLKIEIPPPEVQDAITALDDLRVREQHLLAAIRQKRSQLLLAISMKAARRPS
ncbi:MAG: hypothetical protein KatS3mg114_0463 [Planctomycetaceae bacterium]|nr:MAG: hypothetical protein KatS3mg114_0463 [Planctomycetaceae bacterium]